MRRLAPRLARSILLGGLLLAPWGGAAPAKSGWRPLFNGKDLAGWTPKIRGYPLGENFGDTFRVEGGVLKVGYDRYPEFGDRFGHLAWREPLSRYRLRIEYRFVGGQAKGGPAWALRNSGVMVHGQAPASMARDQKFPVSIEVQFLGGTGAGPRPTLNVCTPGTHVVIDGQLVTKHCTNSRAPTYDGDQWVTVEVLVDGGKRLEHLVNGKPVLSYGQPQLDPADPDARRLLEAGAGKALDRGYLYLQAESHPVEFRRVEIQPLD
jgi:hypothetical protein